MAVGRPRGRKLAPERLELLGKLVADGWPIRQITETHGFNYYTIKKHYPEYKGMTQSEAGKIGMALKHLGRKVAV